MKTWKTVRKTLLFSLSFALVSPVAIAGNHGGSPSSTEAAQAPANPATKDIVDTAVAAGSFKTLATALQAADLVNTLKGPGPFTVFAPTDEAFAKIPKDKLEALLKDKAKLTAVLTYHVVPGKVLAQEVSKMSRAKTVQGKEAKISIKDQAVYVDSAKVVQTDIAASNGVIHVIDTVLMP